MALHERRSFSGVSLVSGVKSGLAPSARLGPAHTLLETRASVKNELIISKTVAEHHHHHGAGRCWCRGRSPEPAQDGGDDVQSQLCSAGPAWLGFLCDVFVPPASQGRNTQPPDRGDQFISTLEWAARRARSSKAPHRHGLIHLSPSASHSVRHVRHVREY